MRWGGGVIPCAKKKLNNSHTCNCSTFHNLVFSIGCGAIHTKSCVGCVYVRVCEKVRRANSKKNHVHPLIQKHAIGVESLDNPA
jgi:hypothetical protein